MIHFLLFCHIFDLVYLKTGYMRHLWNFFSGLVICSLFLLACVPVTPQNVVTNSGPDIESVRVAYSLFDVIKLILATFGGVATTILLTYLKNRYPKYFGTITIPENSTGKNDEKTG